MLSPTLTMHALSFCMSKLITLLKTLGWHSHTYLSYHAYSLPHNMNPDELESAADAGFVEGGSVILACASRAQNLGATPTFG